MPPRCTNQSFALLIFLRHFPLSLLRHWPAPTHVQYRKGLFVYSYVQFCIQTFWNHFHSLSHDFVCRLSGYLCFGSVIFDRVLEMSQKLTWSIVFAGNAQKHAPSFVWNISSQGIFNIKFMNQNTKVDAYGQTAYSRINSPCNISVVIEVKPIFSTNFEHLLSIDNTRMHWIWLKLDLLRCNILPYHYHYKCCLSLIIIVNLQQPIYCPVPGPWITGG